MFIKIQGMSASHSLQKICKIDDKSNERPTFTLQYFKLEVLELNILMIISCQRTCIGQKQKHVLLS